MLVCAWGMWRLRYWALLGFQALIAIIIILFAFVAVTANDIGRLVIAVVIMGALGTLFWKLVRVLSRLQMPKPS
jgi:lipoprotein signal peptidase